MIRRSIAALEVLLILPAALFMIALVARGLPGHNAQTIVLWYAGKQWTLWVLLIALPLTVLFTGFLTLARSRSLRGDVAAKVIAATAGCAAVILAIVGAHMAMN